MYLKIEEDSNPTKFITSFKKFLDSMKIELRARPEHQKQLDKAISQIKADYNKGKMQNFIDKFDTSIGYENVLFRFAETAPLEAYLVIDDLSKKAKNNDNLSKLCNELTSKIEKQFVNFHKLNPEEFCEQLSHAEFEKILNCFAQNNLKEALPLIRELAQKDTPGNDEKLYKFCGNKINEIFEKFNLQFDNKTGTLKDKTQLEKLCENFNKSQEEYQNFIIQFAQIYPENAYRNIHYLANKRNLTANEKELCNFCLEMEKNFYKKFEDELLMLKNILNTQDDQLLKKFSERFNKSQEEYKFFISKYAQFKPDAINPIIKYLADKKNITKEEMGLCVFCKDLVVKLNLKNK